MPQQQLPDLNVQSRAEAVKRLPANRGPAVVVELPDGITMNTGKRRELGLGHPACAQQGGELANDHRWFPSQSHGNDVEDSCGWGQENSVRLSGERLTISPTTVLDALESHAIERRRPPL
jgi:hypothetical protein